MPSTGSVRTGPVLHRGRGSWELLRDRSFGPFFVGKVLATTGIWMYNVTAAILMFQLTGSALLVGAVSVAQFAASIVLALPVGVLTDRYDRRKLLIIGQAISSTCMAALALLVTVAGSEALGPFALLAVVLVMGIGLSLVGPATQALVPALVSRDDLPQALALTSAAPSIARAVGPAVGALLVVWGGAAPAFAVGAGTHVVFLVLLVFLKTRAHVRSDKRARLLGGARYLLVDRNAALLILGVALLAFGSDPILTLTPSLATLLGGGNGVVGLLASSFGLGAVLVTVLLRLLRRWMTLRVQAILGFWILSAGLCSVALSTRYWVAAAGFLAAGAGFMMATVGLTTRIQQRVPEQLRGRVMAIWSAAWLGTRPFAAAFNGAIADLVSVRVALLVAAAVTLLASACARVRYRTDPGLST